MKGVSITMGITVKRDKAQEFPMPGEKQSPFSQARRTAEGRMSLFHYTNIDALFAILKYRQIKFNRIDLLNDLREINYFSIQDEYKYTYFVSSFSHDTEDNESIPLWHMYTSGKYGVRIGFESAQNNTFLSAVYQDKIVGVNESDGKKGRLPSFVTNSIRITDVLYPTNDKDADIFFVDHPSKGKIIFDDAIGSIKNECWKYEHETRLVVSLTPIMDTTDFPMYSHLFVPIDFNLFSEIKITFSPFMSCEVKESVKLMCENLSQKLSVKIDYKDSKFDGEITRKE